MIFIILSTSKKLKIVIDSTSPITFINSKTWLDLNKRKLQAITSVLGALFTYVAGYFETKTSQKNASKG